MERTTWAATERLIRLPDRAAGARLIPLLDEHPVSDLRAYAARIEAVEVTAAAHNTQLDVVAMAEYLATLIEVFDHELDERRMGTGLTRGPGGFRDVGAGAPLSGG